MLETSPALEVAAPMSQRARPLGELLVAKGLLTEEQLRLALAEQAESGRLLGEIVVQRDLVSMVALVNALVEQLREAREVSYRNELRLPIFSDVTKVDFPWRPLGELLVERGFIVPRELEAALTEQQRTGRKLGEILVDQGALTGSQLTRVLVEQTGLRLEDSAPEAEPLATPADGEPWRPLGRVLVDRGVIAETDLEEALHVQRATGRRLGEILVERGYATAQALVSAVIEQHGLEEETPTRAVLATSAADKETYQVEYHGAEEGKVVFRSEAFLDAVDFAFEYLEAERPERLRIFRILGRKREEVWSYGPEEQPRDVIEVFGYDVVRWSGPSDWPAARLE
jgi:hypothetical protein